MITIEEFKQAIDSLSPEVHNQAKELVKTWTENMNRISEEPELDIDESDELEQIADEAKSKLLTLLFDDIYFVLEYMTKKRTLSRTYTNIISNERLYHIRNHNHQSQGLCH